MNRLQRLIGSGGYGDRDSDDRPVLRWLVAILVSSTLLRLAASLWMGNRIDLLPGIADQLSYHTLALRLLGGHGFTFGQPWWPATRAGQPTAHWSYLYTFYLWGVYKLFGPNPLAARLIQSVMVGLMMPWLVYRLGARIFGRRAALMAAGWSALYPYYIYYAAALMTESLYACALLFTFVTAVQMADRIGGRGSSSHSLGSAILLGLGLGSAILLRQVAMVLAPVIFGWLLWMRWGRRRLTDGLVQIVLSSMVIGALVAPFTWYNYVRFDRFVLLNTNAGFAFYLSNHPFYGTDFQPILESSTTTYADLIPSDLAGSSEAELDQELLLRGLGFVRQDPVRYLRLSIGRITDYLMFWPAPQSGWLSNIARVGSFGLAFPFILAGLWLSLKDRNFVNGQAIVLLLVSWLGYAAVHILSWSLVRYRLPLDTLLLLFAGYALDRAWRVIGRRFHRLTAREVTPVATSN